MPTNYDEMSDFEVNKRLAELLGNNVCSNQSDIDKNKGMVSCVPLGCNRGYYDINYCNSWADIGPLMIKYDVYILPKGDNCEQKYLAKTLIDSSIGMGWTTKYTSFHDNPLRAAAICLIKKLEAENAN